MCIAFDSSGTHILYSTLTNNPSTYKRPMLQQSGSVVQMSIYIINYNLSNVHHSHRRAFQPLNVCVIRLYNVLRFIIYFTEHFEFQLHQGRIYRDCWTFCLYLFYTDSYTIFKIKQQNILIHRFINVLN